MILDLVPEDHPILKEELPRFDFSNPPTDPIQLAKDLAETMIANKGIGLAANQCGLNYRVFVMSGEQIRAFFNPRIVDVSEEEVVISEGCLSFPDMFVKVKRPATVRVRYTQPNGETITEEFGGLSARVVLHETDHLNGLTFKDKANKIHWEQALQKRKIRRRRK